MVASEKVKAKIKDGILEMAVPKAEKEKAKNLFKLLRKGTKEIKDEFSSKF